MDHDESYEWCIYFEWIYVFIDIALVSRIIYSLYKLRIRSPITNLRNNKMIAINSQLIVTSLCL